MAVWTPFGARGNYSRKSESEPRALASGQLNPSPDLSRRAVDRKGAESKGEIEGDLTCSFTATAFCPETSLDPV